MKKLIILFLMFFLVGCESKEYKGYTTNSYNPPVKTTKKETSRSEKDTERKTTTKKATTKKEYEISYETEFDYTVYYSTEHLLLTCEGKATDISLSFETYGPTSKVWIRYNMIVQNTYTYNNYDEPAEFRIKIYDPNDIMVGKIYVYSKDLVTGEKAYINKTDSLDITESQLVDGTYRVIYENMR